MHDVVALERRDRDDLQVGDVELGRERGELPEDLVEDLLVVVDQVHLVHREHQVGHPQQGQDHGVSAGLLGQPLPGVDQHQAEVGEVGGGGAGDHVPGVLHVPGCVGDDELAVRGREVAVRDVDGDALLALGPEAVGQQGQVGVVVAAGLAGRLDGFELVLEDRLGVEQQPPDQRRLAVVDRAGGGKPQQVHRRPAREGRDRSSHQK
jgi:hypothetical protein